MKVLGLMVPEVKVPGRMKVQEISGSCKSDVMSPEQSDVTTLSWLNYFYDAVNCVFLRFIFLLSWSYGLGYLWTACFCFLGVGRERGDGKGKKGVMVGEIERAGGMRYYGKGEGETVRMATDA